MSEEELGQVIKSCIQCGNNISKRALYRLSSAIRSYSQNAPNILISSIKTNICDFDSPTVPTRILAAMSYELSGIESSYFLPIIHSIVKMAMSQSSSVIAPIHNAIFLLPAGALSKEKAHERLIHILDLLQQFIIQNEPFQVLATALSQFMKKWAEILPNPEIFCSSIFSILTNIESFTYSTLSLLCQALTYLLLALVGLDTSLKELIDEIIDKKPTVLDKCTFISNISFIEFVQQTLPTSAKLQLIASVIFSLPDVKISEIANRFTLLSSTIKQPPTDDIGRACFYTMLSAVLKATAKQITPKALNMCCNALFSSPEVNDTANRRAMRYCIVMLLQCASHIQNPSKFYEMLFSRILSLPKTSFLRQDSLPLIIPCMQISNITKTFFQEIIDMIETHQNLALRCLSELYEKFQIPQEYSNLLFSKLKLMSQQNRTIVLNSIAKTNKSAIKLLIEHLTSFTNIEEEEKLTLLLLLASVEAKMTLSPFVSSQLLRNAIHSFDFQVRLSALRLLCGQHNFDKELISILHETIPRVFLYFDIQYQKELERCLELVIPRLKPEQCTTFLNDLMDQILPILKLSQCDNKKSYILNVIKIIWRHKPIQLFSKELLQQLILKLFESNYILRDLIFRSLILINKMINNKTQPNIFTLTFNKDNAFIKELIDKYKGSTRFRETDSAARLIALVHLTRNDQSFEEIINNMWLEFCNDQNQIVSHFPLSVILHILQSTNKIPISISFLTNKMFPKLCKLIRESLDYIGVTVNIESMPIHSIKGEIVESQTHTLAIKYWLVVRQSLNIISCIINRCFEDISKEVIKETGDTLLNFLVESCNYSSVYYAHLTFQALCARCFTRENCSNFPYQWTISLLEASGNFTKLEHRISGGFIQAAMALIHSEPMNLFGSQRSIYHLMVQHCFTTLDNPCSVNDIISALLLTESIATDLTTQSNFEPYAVKLIMSVLFVNCQPMSFELKTTANHCLTTLLLRHWGHKEEPKEYKCILNTDFFKSVEGAYDFFLEHLLEQDQVTYIILQIIQIMKPFPNIELFERISDLCSCKSSRLRRAASRALLVVIDPLKAEEFVSKRIHKIINIKNDTNTIDGILLQIQQLSRKFPNVVKNLYPEVYEMCSTLIKNHITDYIQIYIYVSLASEFDCLDIMYPILIKIFQERNRIKHLPFGYQLIRTSFSILNEEQIINLLESNELTFKLHYLLSRAKMKMIKSDKIKSVLLDLLLNDKNNQIFDILCPIITKEFQPNELQKRRFIALLYETKEDAKLTSLLNLIPIFLSDVKIVMHRFSKFSTFDYKPIQNILFGLSKLTLVFHEQMYSKVINDIPWKITLRILSDENPQIREPCCKALSYHFCYNENQRIELCEYDLINLIYKRIANYPNVINSVLNDMKKNKECEKELKYKNEVSPFLFPPSFHIKCIKNAIDSLKK